MILIVKIFALLLGSVVITKTFLDYKKGQENLTMFAFWSLTWLSVIIIALRPLIIDNILVKISGQRTGLGTFIGMAFIFILFIMYRIYQKSNRIELQLRNMVSKLGLRDIDKID